VRAFGKWKGAISRARVEFEVAVATEHAVAIGELESAHAKAIEEIEANNSRAIQQLESEHANTIEGLEVNHDSAIRELESKVSQRDDAIRMAKATLKQVRADHHFSVPICMRIDCGLRRSKPQWQARWHSESESWKS
jgi:hypothetical protein